MYSYVILFQDISSSLGVENVIALFSCVGLKFSIANKMNLAVISPIIGPIIGPMPNEFISW